MMNFHSLISFVLFILYLVDCFSCGADVFLYLLQLLRKFQNMLKATSGRHAGTICVISSSG